MTLVLQSLKSLTPLDRSEQFLIISHMLGTWTLAGDAGRIISVVSLVLMGLLIIWAGRCR